MIWFYIVAVVAVVTVLVTIATRPISFTLGLIQTLSFMALAFGLIGWFAVLPDPVFLWSIGIGGGIWLLTTVLRGSIST